MRTGKITIAAASIACILALTGCDKLKSRDQLNQGVLAFKNAKYSEAVDHFKQAIALDESNPYARLYLATAYMSQWIPGAESPENTEMANKARDEFNKVLEKNPNEPTAIASLASLSYNEASSLPPDKKLEKLDEAAKWYKRLIEVDPKNKEAYYSLGVIAWAKWYPQDMLARANAHMKPEDPGPLKDKKVKEELKAQYGPIIDEGMANLNKALEIDPKYEDAMSYLNLLIREKADLLDSPEEYKEQVKIADGWIQKALDTKKEKAAEAAAHGNGITAETAK
ncbi:MAG TPA: tetratricopeptide repeat protein [Bryobacteraceae bacterium]|jgi:tetratricopeptide (TPR) repeat protein|nr:tetratricopeptide repeat protein [Bryobacteraceae bacterium]